MGKENFDLKTIIKKLAKEGKIKVYSFEESQAINQRINEGLGEFIKEEKIREHHANLIASKRVYK